MRDGMLATHGWEATTLRVQLPSRDKLPIWRSPPYTDIGRDGGHRTQHRCHDRSRRVSGLPVIASGGVRDLVHLEQLYPRGSATAARYLA
jgi:phosphoribosylformimino-5-aminoimidazole carboxamide ribonucleotide (ProFAR) isomerase